MTLDDLTRFLKPVMSRVKGIVTKGILESVDDTKDIQLVKYTGLDGEVVSGAERLQPSGIASHPEKGASLIVLANNGSKDHPVVIVVDDGLGRPKVENPKDKTFYDGWGNTIVMTEAGIVVTDSKGNNITTTEDGIVITDVNSNVTEMTADGVKITSKGNTYEMIAGQVSINGGNLEVLQ